MGLVSLYMAAECIARLMFEFRARYNCLERLYIGAFFYYGRKNQKKNRKSQTQNLSNSICSDLVWQKLSVKN